MLCALCKKDSQLQRSHVIPEFFFAPLYDEKHRFNLLTVVPGERDLIQQKGARESLLCLDCERRLSRFERYASLVLNGGAPGVEAQRDGAFIRVRGIDYKKLKIFFLSLIWRAGVASDPFFEKVRLGHHEDKMRRMILVEDAGPFDLYPCVIFGVTMEPGVVPGLMIQPCREKMWGHTTYHLVLPGIKLVYFVSSHRLGSIEREFFLKEDGSLVFDVRSAAELPALRNFMSKFQAQGRRPRLEA